MSPEEIAEVLLVSAGVVVGFVAGWLHGVGTPEPIAVGAPITAMAAAVGLVLTAIAVEKRETVV